MGGIFEGNRGWLMGLVGLGLLALAPCSSFGQDVSWGWGRKSCPPEPCPIPPTKPCPEVRPEVPPTKPELPPTAPEATTPAPSEAFLPPERFAAVGGETFALATPNMLGDFLATSSFRCVPVQIPTTQTIMTTGNLCVSNPIGIRPLPPQFVVVPAGMPCPPGFTMVGKTTIPVQVTVPGTTTSQVCYRVPAVCHEFKIAEDENPRPQDRIYFGENNYSNVLPFARAGTDIRDMNVNRFTIGFEKTFFDRNASIGMRAPLNTLNIGGSDIPGVNGHFTDVGDLTIILKVVLLEDREIGHILSGGLAVTVPTGSTTFANSGFGMGCDHSTLLQPYLGYALVFGNAFIHGFSALDIPTGDDSTLYYQDLGVGYFVMRDRNNDSFLTAVVPTFEVHATIPLNRQGSINDPMEMGFTPNVVDLTEGVTFEIRRRCTLAVGVAEPVTGPRPFDIEAIGQLNIRF